MFIWNNKQGKFDFFLYYYYIFITVYWGLFYCAGIGANMMLRVLTDEEERQLAHIKSYHTVFNVCFFSPADGKQIDSLVVSPSTQTSQQGRC